jgi:uncharacterized protein YndB with AHSA1/START domain
MNKPSSVYVTYIAASPEAVWQALTEPRFTRRYWPGGKVSSDWQVGSPVQYLTEGGAVGWEGEVVQADAPRVLAFTLHMLISEAHRLEAPSRVSFELEVVQGVVKLTLTHDNFESDSATYDTTVHGWPAIMSSLKSLIETGHPLPFARMGFAPGQREQES